MSVSQPRTSQRNPLSTLAPIMAFQSCPACRAHVGEREDVQRLKRAGRTFCPTLGEATSLISPNARTPQSGAHAVDILDPLRRFTSRGYRAADHSHPSRRSDIRAFTRSWRERTPADRARKLALGSKRPRSNTFPPCDFARYYY